MHTKKRRSSGYQIPLYTVNEHVEAGDDFYKYINGKWLHHTEIPPTKTAFGVSEEIEEQIIKDSKDLLNRCIEVSKHTNHNPSYKQSLEKLLGDLGQSVLSAETETSNLNTVRTILSSLQTLQSKEEVAVVMGEFLRYKIRGLFTIYGQYENKNNTEYTYTIGIGNLGLDASFYHWRSLHRSTSLKLYKKMIHHLGKKFHIPQLDCVVKLEKIIAAVILRTDRDIVEHEKTGKELEEQFQHIPFSILFETMGFHNWRSRKFFVESLRWLHCINKLYHHLGIDYWRLLFSLEFLLYSLPWLPSEYSDLSFQFYRKQLRGQQKKMSRQDQMVYVAQQFATPFFSRLYVDDYVNKKSKHNVKTMVEDLLHFAEDRLKTIEWLEPKTREKAKEKVNHMRYIVAYPDTFEHHSLPKLSSTDLLTNLLQLGEWQTKYEMKKLGQPITQRKEWDDAVFVVNAYYYGQANEMVIPSGILNPPFYDESKSLAWNYGGIGCILAHELTHAFDKEGKEYDPNGFQKKWWTPGDNRRYNEQTKALIELYGKQRMNGFPVSGRKTLSENIADIGGMGIALDAFKHKLGEMKCTDEDRHKAYREFFTSYATSWRLKERKKKRIQALITDRHAPPPLRVNLVVSQFQEWYDAFEIKPGDKLYISPEKRIRIF